MAGPRLLSGGTCPEARVVGDRWLGGRVGWWSDVEDRWLGVEDQGPGIGDRGPGER
jgi:hypothetical protein